MLVYACVVKIRPYKLDRIIVLSIGKTFPEALEENLEKIYGTDFKITRLSDHQVAQVILDGRDEFPAGTFFHKANNQTPMLYVEKEF